MRRASASAIPPHLYRHFAIVTVALTASLAMFADGEGREAQAAQALRQQPTAPVAPATFELAAENEDEDSGGWSDDGDFGGGFAAPVAIGFDSADSGIMPELDTLEALGYSPDYLAELNDKERALLLQGLRENGMLTPDIRRRRSAALEAASGRRSGSSSSEP